MIVAAAGGQKVRGTSPGKDGPPGSGASHPGERFQRGGDFSIRQPEISEPALRPDGDDASFDELSQMAAGALRSDAGDFSQFACRQRETVAKRHKHGLSRRVRQQGCNLGESGLHRHSCLPSARISRSDIDRLRAP
jgi:hypothetical protein